LKLTDEDIKLLGLSKEQTKKWDLEIEELEFFIEHQEEILFKVYKELTAPYREFLRNRGYSV